MQTPSCVPIIQFSFPLFPSTRGRCRQHRQNLSSGRGCVRSWKRVRVSWRRGRMSAQIRCYSCRVTWRYTKATVTETIMRVSKELSDTSQIFAKADKPQDPALCTPHLNYTEMYRGKACHLYMLCNWECVRAAFCGTGGDAEETYWISAAGESRASFLHLRAGGREPQPERTSAGTHRWGKTDFHFTFIQIFRIYGIYYTVKKLTSCISFNSHISCSLISFFICVSLFYTLTGQNHEWWNSSTEIYEDASGLEQLLRTDNSTARQLRETEHRLRMKEKKVKICQSDHWNSK